MKQYLLFSTIAFLAATGLVFGQEESSVTYKQYSDGRSGFSIDVPEGWTQRTDVQGVALDLSSSDSLANQRVVVQPTGGKSADAILSAMETQLSYTNMLDNHNLAAATRKTMNATDAAVGAYSVNKNDVDLNQRIWVIVKGAKAYIIVETVPDDNLTDYIDIFDHVSKSIRLR